MAETLKRFSTSQHTYTKERTSSGTVRYRKDGQFTSQQAFAGAQSTNPQTGKPNVEPSGDFVPGRAEDLMRADTINNRFAGFAKRYRQSNPDASDEEIREEWEDFEAEMGEAETLADANEIRQRYGLPDS